MSEPKEPTGLFGDEDGLGLVWKWDGTWLPLRAIAFAFTDSPNTVHVAAQAGVSDEEKASLAAEYLLKHVGDP